MDARRAPVKLAIAGLGAIGLPVARRVDAGDVPGLALVAVSVRDEAKARKAMAGFRHPPPLLGLAALADAADVVVECLPSARFLEVAEPAVTRGRIFMPLSVGALLDHMPLVDLARETGARIIVPTGALLGLDAVRAAAEGRISSARIVTRKPPRGLAGAPLLVERGISVDAIKEPLRVFEGSAREAIAGFPANVNVAVALSLAGIGPDQTRIEIWADPGVTRNTHTVVVKSDSSDLTMTIENIPSEENPRTGRITALSVLAALRRLTAPLVIGS
jgi:aspartate dehydrogenase